jgi:hypothetical protein
MAGSLSTEEEEEVESGPRRFDPFPHLIVLAGASTRATMQVVITGRTGSHESILCRTEHNQPAEKAVPLASRLP